MMGTTGFRALRAGRHAALVALLLPVAAPLRAAEEDTQLWLTATGTLPLGEEASATVEISPRWREQGNVLQSRAALDLEVSDRAKVGVGVTHVELAGAYEVRPHQQVELTFGPLTTRTRIEQRFFGGGPSPAERAQVRLRQRIGTTIRLTRRMALMGTGELLYIARPERAADEARIDNWRALLALQRRLSPRLTAGLGYLLIYSPRRAAPDRISHVPQLTLVFRR